MSKSKEWNAGYEQHKAELKEGLEDMQGLIARGYDSLNAAQYILLRITDAAKAKIFFKKLITHYINRASKKEPVLTDSDDPIRAVHLAFTSTGLKQLGLPDNVLNTFSREFIEGMSFMKEDPDNPGKFVSERSTILGDTGNSDPTWWYWGNKDNYADCALLLYAETQKKLDLLVSEVYDPERTGLEKVHYAANFNYDPYKTSKEHFGFADGISQPIINGMKKSHGFQSLDNLFNPGEFILGYKNEYDNYSPSPFVPDGIGTPDLPRLPEEHKGFDLGKNGTYLVFRQMEQHVEEFWRYHYHHSKEAGVTQTEKAVHLGAKMVGRWPDGHSLVNCPAGSCRPRTQPTDEFMYAEEDPNGVKCPLGAHIRRTNPRDQVHTGRNAADSMVMSKRHRMLRRGRIYGQPLTPDMDIEKVLCQVKNDPAPVCPEAVKGQTPIVRGLHFICLVSDIGRQFEFVQSVWANTSIFADLRNEVDPVISPRPSIGQPDCRDFTTPQETIRKRYSDIPQFTTVIGGAYFFLPGIKALTYITSDHKP